MPTEQTKRTWQNLQLFDDEPKRPAGLSTDDGHVDPVRLAPIVNVLCNHLYTALKGTPESRERQLRLGLFGGLGQGKTTAIWQAIGQLCQQRFLPRRLLRWCKRAPRCEFFDAAAHKPDLLEFEFDRLIGRWYLGLHLWRFIVLFLGVLLLLFLCYAPFAHLISWLSGRGFWSIYQFILPPILVIPLVGILTFLVRLAKNWSVVHYVFRDVERQFSLRSSPWSNLKKHIRFVLCPPDILVVDNLDRANVQQQRSLLRAVRKHSDEWRLPIVVVMDETELLRAKPYDAEAPEELLRKAIQVECRMPIRMGDDAALLVAALATEGAKKNAHNQAGRLLTDARLQGDWTRVFVLSRGLGPRRIKRFLNDLFSSCAELDVPHPDDVAALTRLYALFSLAPELRSRGEQVVLALAANDEPAFHTLCSKLAPGELTVQIRQFLQTTRHMQPQDGNWRRLVAKIIRHDPPRPFTADTSRSQCSRRRQ